MPERRLNATLPTPLDQVAVLPMPSVKSGCVSSTTTTKVCVALNVAGPSSVTITEMRFVRPPWVSLGRQVNTPLVGWTDAPAGALARLNVSFCAGKSVSTATLVNVSSEFSASV
jgi:hypothetical protein